MKYQIKVRGLLDEDWAAWLGGVEMTLAIENGLPITLICGDFPDQPALFGILNRLRDMNLPLIAVQQIDEPGEAGFSLRNE